jgi:hypothetical protein
MRKICVPVLALAALALGLTAQGAPAPLRPAPDKKAAPTTICGTLLSLRSLRSREARPRRPIIEHWYRDGAAAPSRKGPTPLPTGLVWEVEQGCQAYRLDFNGDAKLRELARKLDGKTVEVVGQVETWTVHRFPKPDEQGRAIAIAYAPYKVQVMVVSGLRPLD